ncbi:GntR family transcriptional regulator [Enterococcus casseliflavus]|uniref:GntR family transcriptional regulator n=1 Tax=Enterococcus casseliflavus TaxID=37734 RepID=UPI0023305726|nr:GntR family transcriptional regulator [Enterococcus casseliflavus]MDB1691679.1 GntR family transcriptional regulator [Enterococcus casseliflavus]
MKRKHILYRDVADKLKEDIMSGRYPIGSFLPTETELEATFNVSKITVRKAIELLAADEYVEKRSGRGTTVLSNRPYNKLSKGTTFSQLLEKTGKEYTKKNLSYELVELAPEHPAYSLMGKEVMRLSRMYYFDHQPFIYYEYHLPKQLKGTSIEVFEEKSLYRLLDEHRMIIDRFQDAFVATTLTEEQQKFMITPEVAALKRTRYSYDLQGEVVEYTEGIYNTALHPYMIEFEA